ncbi:MAG: hypothetical protein ACREA0_00765 [bacterium]
MGNVGGNVWEWVSDWYRPDYYAQLAARGAVARPPLLGAQFGFVFRIGSVSTYSPV